MFTGIIEATGLVQSVSANGTNKTFVIESPLSNELKVDQSICHNGVCLTVEQTGAGSHTVTAIEETLQKTNLSGLKTGAIVNLERCLQMNGRLDGHIVQGHVDGIATCSKVENKNGSYEYRFDFDPKFAGLVIEKGSVCLNGISLTLFNVTGNSFDVAIIPYTYEHTNIKEVQPGSVVNIEFDVIGKYLARMQEVNHIPKNG